jgi:hypothetical protein
MDKILTPSHQNPQEPMSLQHIDMLRLYKRIQRKEKAKERFIKIEKLRLERLENLD